MPENNRRKKTVSADSSKRRKQQPNSKRKVESSVKQTRVTREKKTTVKNTRRDNPRLSMPNPRRIQKHTKLYAFLVAGILILLGVVLFLMLFTFTAADLAADAEQALNLFGFIGAHIADIMLTLFGLAAFLFSAVCLLMGICSIFGRQIDVNAASIIGIILLILGCSPVAQIAFSDSKILEHAPGGVLGEWSVSFVTAHMPTSAFMAICIGMTVFGGLLVTDTSLKAFFLGLWKIISWVFKTLGKALAEPFKKRPEVATENVVETQSSETDDSQDISESLFYEDTTSQLLDGKVSDLKEREAMAKAAEEAKNAAVDIDEDDMDDQDDVSVPETPVMKPRIEDVSADIDDPDGLLSMEPDDVIAPTEAIKPVKNNTPEPVKNIPAEPEIAEKQEKPEKTEALGDIMARIIKNTPKKRSIKKRSPSVPAIEPDFEFDSIVAPEQLHPEQVPVDEAQPQKVLGNWKPRSIAKKHVDIVEKPKNPVAPEQPTLALSDIHNESVRKALSIPAPEVPTHLTKDLLAQLQTEDLEITPSMTRQVPKMHNYGSAALADTAELAENKANKNSNDRPTLGGAEIKSPKKEERPTLESPKADVAKLQLLDITKEQPASAKKNLVSGSDKDDKTAVPISAELRALMAEAGFKASKKADYSDLSFDDFETPQKPSSDAPTRGFALEEMSEESLKAASRDDSDDFDDFEPIKNAQSANKMRNSFVVAEGKKCASEDELIEAERARLMQKNQPAYEFPPMSLLHYDSATQKGLDNDALRVYADKIEQKLAEYHIQGQVVQICPGPIITRFEFQPAPGTKVSKIASLTDDLMMALEIKSLRILAPIPGKGVVGIEIPNEKRNTIYFKEIIASKQFTESKSILTIALGKDPEGEPVVSDLAKMPHLLVAGSTGSGKSVGINTMICSLLYNASPDDVKMILVDPKCLELSIYEGIPHLLVPPITTPAETSAALEWACDEMDERYRKLSDLGVRNISGYNEQVKNPTLPKAIEAMRETDAEGNPKYQHMPYIVIVVDEFADLMMTAGKEIERSIARLAQKARAAGIHIILATQRPSTNVITGIIKANFPTRLAFRVFSYVDSRTILDQKGAECLLGMGDSLFLPPNTAVLQRVHGAFVSDDEVQSIVSFLSKQRAPEYNLDITTPKETDSFDDEPASGGSCDFDPLYDQAVRIVAETRQASASFLQRRMSIGFNRAARIIEQMEREGVVGPQKGQKPREVLIGSI